ncbi:hypothetical protein [Pseudoduganella chitinolytica]|uniref:Uncharacterized protein n=1 Tax=Pseudoduganella chitinolytica TaxID=34070 RepID=A0ABY8BP50_9BURK|nr:hypothetical protein [Pseudoduganella chitinolytica]WEF36039.1 hypothetical protein PX653_26305 [Pseudoduganella chitinolytica]
MPDRTARTLKLAANQFAIMFGERLTNAIRDYEILAPPSEF